MRSSDSRRRVDVVIRPGVFATNVGSHAEARVRRWPSPTDVAGRDPGRSEQMASTPLIRRDAGELRPSILVLLMLILASLGVVAQAATL
jgi:hypothetical protein